MKRLWRRVLAGLLVPALIWFAWFESNTIASEQTQIALDGLPAAFGGFRIALVADLHGKTFGSGNARLLAALRDASPDLIAVCGDWIDDADELAAAAVLAEQMTAIAPVAYVTGNHEWASGAARALMESLEQAGVLVLANAYTVLERGDARLILAGVHDPNGPYDMKTPQELMQEIRAQQPGAVVVMLAHRNDEIAQWAALDVPLVLSGHGHGGVIRLPLLGGLLGTDRSLLPDYTAGLYRQGNTQMFVSRGLGSAGLMQRLFNRPDLPILILRTESAENP